MQEIAIRYVNTQHYRQQMHNNYCTFLKSGLLEAPREYVLHGLVPGLDWAPFWALPMSMHLVATPSPVSCRLLQRLKFHLAPLLSVWLLTNVEVNITTLYPTHGHMYIHHTDVTINSFFFLTHLLFSSAGWLCPTRSVCYSYTYTKVLAQLDFCQG